MFGGTGANKTTGFAMPNILQLKVDRDMVVGLRLVVEVAGVHHGRAN